MAKMIPSNVSHEEFHGSVGEEKIYNALSKLPDEYVVFHSVHWNKARPSGNIVWGESDFAVFHPSRGLIVIEVKSGGISCKDGRWFQTNTLTGECKQMKRPPMVQAERSKFTFADLLAYSKLETVKEYWVECAVWFPSVADRNKIGSMPCEYSIGNVLLQQDLENPAAAIARMFDFYRMHASFRASKAESDEVIRILAPSFDAIPNFSGKAFEQDYYFNRMTMEQSYLLDYLEEQRVAAIQGGAGTGKTMLAIEKARRLAETDQVLFLCFNHHLLQYLQKTYSVEIPNVTFANLPLLTCRHMKVSDAGGDEGISHYLNDYDKYSWPYKHIIIDEGQDFLEYHLELLYAIAEITDGCFYVFYDKNQLVQQRQTLDWVNRIECRLVLSCNCRNTRNIAVTSYKPLGIDKIKMRVDIPGQKPTMHLTQNIDDARQTIGNIIRNYTRQGIQKKQIVILTVKTEEASLLSGVSSVAGYTLAQSRDSNGIMFTSSRKFKGLESDVVIIVDVDDSCFLDDEKRRVFYVESSRAKHFLDIVSVMDDQHVNNMVVQLTGEEKKNARLALASFLKVKLVSGSVFSA